MLVCEADKRGRASMADSDYPVSYTHLDVYKRQPHASAQNLDAQRSQINAALIAAEKGQPVAPGLEKHPLYGWVELATLRRNIDTVSNAQAQSFLKRYEGQAVADAFRTAWLPALSRRQDWPTLLSAWKPTTNVALRCAELNARQAMGKADAQWTSDALAVWRSTGKSLPDGLSLIHI